MSMSTLKNVKRSKLATAPSWLLFGSLLLEFKMEKKRQETPFWMKNQKLQWMKINIGNENKLIPYICEL